MIIRALVDRIPEVDPRAAYLLVLEALGQFLRHPLQDLAEGELLARQQLGDLEDGLELSGLAEGVGSHGTIQIKGSGQCSGQKQRPANAGRCF